MKFPFNTTCIVMSVAPYCVYEENSKSFIKYKSNYLLKRRNPNRITPNDAFAMTCLNYFDQSEQFQLV